MLFVTSAIFGMSRVRGSKQEQYLKIDILSLPTVWGKICLYRISRFPPQVNKTPINLTIPTKGKTQLFIHSFTNYQCFCVNDVQYLFDSIGLLKWVTFSNFLGQIVKIQIWKIHNWLYFEFVHFLSNFLFEAEISTLKGSKPWGQYCTKFQCIFFTFSITVQCPQSCLIFLNIT